MSGDSLDNRSRVNICARRKGLRKFGAHRSEQSIELSRR